MSNLDTQRKNDLNAVLTPANRRRNKLLRWLIVIVAVVALGGYFLFGRGGSGNTVVQYQTEKLQQGTLKVMVQATGTLEPVKQVDVGSELSGLVQEVLVDENDKVTKGQVLIKLDTSKLDDAIIQSQAAVASAEAGLLEAQATVKESGVSLDRLKEVFKLSGGKVPSATEMSQAEATYARALAGEASAKAAVSESRAALSTNTINKSKAWIRSAIDGVVLTRSVEPGQTVAAAMSVTTLLTLAEDLTQMKLEVKIDEADVGKVAAGQPASFTVDAHPGRSYPAAIQRVGYGSSTTNNVVSYPALLTVTNPDLSLRPGMTATADIITAVRENVLLVPNAATRYTPAATAAAKRSFLSRLMPGGPRRNETKKVETKFEGTRTLWFLVNGQATAVQVTVGATNGKLTEVSGTGVKPGMEVITDTLAVAQ
jgi:HlyD family secretion protein